MPAPIKNTSTPTAMCPSVLSFAKSLIIQPTRPTFSAPSQRLIPEVQSVHAGNAIVLSSTCQFVLCCNQLFEPRSFDSAEVTPVQCTLSEVRRATVVYAVDGVEQLDEGRIPYRSMNERR